MLLRCLNIQIAGDQITGDLAFLSVFGKKNAFQSTLGTPLFAFNRGRRYYISQPHMHYAFGKFPWRPPSRSKVTLLYQIQPMKNFKKNKKAPFHVES